LRIWHLGGLIQRRSGGVNAGAKMHRLARAKLHQ
jgi:hypothetical protein